MNIASIMAMTNLVPKNLPVTNDENGDQSFIDFLGKLNMQSKDALNNVVSNLTLKLVDADESDTKLLNDNQLAELNIEQLQLLLNEINQFKNSDEKISIDDLRAELNVVESENIQTNNDVFEIVQQSQNIDKLEQLVLQTRDILNRLDETNVKQISRQLLTLLQNLSPYTNEENNDEMMRHFQEKLSKEDSDLLNRLLNLFQNRHSLVLTGAYRHEANVTSDDIAKWLQEAMNNQDVKVSEMTVVPVKTSSEHVPMTHVEQYVIHLNESDRVEKIQEQLIRQFETVLKQSRFLKGPELTQLSFTLQPNNLGNVQVQLIEINGELVVKMIASSLAAKKMLESNIHQLKHLFAPHNIIIERNDTEIEDIEHVDEQLDDEEEAMQEERDENDKSSQEDDNRNFNDHFQTILTNMNTEIGNEVFNDD